MGRWRWSSSARRALRVLGPGVETLAKRDGFPTLVRSGDLMAATFHPELSNDSRVHQMFLDVVREHKEKGGQ